jgi:catechol 2,3-dioxygenase-like lactoylglutathione lyase family enzyme
MFDHLGIVVGNLNAARAFYGEVLAPLGVTLTQDNSQAEGTGWLVFAKAAPETPFFVVSAGRPSFWKSDSKAGASPGHIAFKAPSRAAVDAFHSAGVAAGGANNGNPGLRRGRYYAAFLIDPDGNNIEAGVYSDG